MNDQVGFEKKREKKMFKGRERFRLSKKLRRRRERERSRGSEGGRLDSVILISGGQGYKTRRYEGRHNSVIIRGRDKLRTRLFATRYSPRCSSDTAAALPPSVCLPRVGVKLRTRRVFSSRRNCLVKVTTGRRERKSHLIAPGMVSYNSLLSSR